ncbi:MAG: sugar phosphate isomerase/epimerase [Candidatus Hydrogenedentes bacterium]|nr:sugar phosphate isomerase/epimerase [Candidatus Hydrogenedentota bacterium]
MKTAINQWAFPSTMPAAEAITRAHRHGFQAIELCVDEASLVRLDSSEADVTALRKHADKLGIDISSVACGLGWKYPMSSLDSTVREQGKKVTARALQIAAWLGAGSLLVVPGNIDAQTPYDTGLENALSAVRDLVPEAERLKVSVAIENVWNKFLLSPIEMRDFIDHCESEYVGAYFDTGNILVCGFPEQWIRILGRRIRSIHAKDFRNIVGNIQGFVMLMEGDVNWPEVVSALKDAGYDGALVAEFGPYAHSLDVMLTHVHASLSAIVSM